ncbi:M28 family metallopeptidase [Ancylomarina sp.]|uniref:M28 family metallopeptidase n=1 Tax=Ancylomarina sp. TaxID=1970196 RepID=UPI003563029F
MNYKRLVLILALTLFASSLWAQDMNYARKVIKDLSSDDYFGRGYINKGDSIAAVYLSAEMRKLKLDGFSPNFYQLYTTPINTFPEDPILKLGDKQLESAKDFIVYPDSPSCEGTFDVLWLNTEILTKSKIRKEFLKKDLSQTFLAIDSVGLNNKQLYNFASDLVSTNLFGAKGVLLRKNKLKYSARTFLKDFPTLIVKSSKLDTTTSKITVKIKNQFIENYKTQNLMGYIQGQTDSCLIYCAHYDHLGMMGSKIYPGANDNGSGVAMVLNLAKHYKKAKKKPHYTQVFLLFSGEEAGLLGSQHYVEHPLFPLEKTKLVINFDMIGTGSEGVSIYNGSVYPKEVALYTKLNDEHSYVENLVFHLPDPSSDHYSFYKKEVKSIFFYSEGDNEDYHETTDTYGELKLTQFEGLFKLVRDFSEQLK